MIDKTKYINSAAILNKLAMNYENLGDGHKALEYYTKALEIFSLVSDLDNKAIVLNNVGHLFKNHGSFSNALNCFREVSEIMRDKNNRIGHVIALCNMTAIYMDMGDFEKMLNSARLSLDLVQAISQPAQEAVCRLGVALALHGMGKTNKAIPYLEQSINLLERNNISRDASGTSIAQHRDLLQTMKTDDRKEIFESTNLSTAMRKFITAESWNEALEIFEQNKTLLSHPEVEKNIKEGIIKMRRTGAIQQASNLQAHLKLLRRAKSINLRSSKNKR
jgi:tetratricopeptide (TPR) repeat protein